MKGSVSDLSSTFSTTENQNNLDKRKHEWSQQQSHTEWPQDEITDDICAKTLASNGKDTAPSLDEVSYLYIRNLTEDKTELRLEKGKSWRQNISFLKPIPIPQTFQVCHPRTARKCSFFCIWIYLVMLFRSKPAHPDEVCCFLLILAATSQFLHPLCPLGPRLASENVVGWAMGRPSKNVFWRLGSCFTRTFFCEMFRRSRSFSRPSRGLKYL